MFAKIRPQVMTIGLGLVGLAGYALYLGQGEIAGALGGGLLLLLKELVSGPKD